MYERQNLTENIFIIFIEQQKIFSLVFNFLHTLYVCKELLISFKNSEVFSKYTFANLVF